MEDYRNEMEDVVNEGDQWIYGLVLGAVYTSDSTNQSGGWELIGIFERSRNHHLLTIAWPPAATDNADVLLYLLSNSATHCEPT
jgi:hypothetical protein